MCDDDKHGKSPKSDDENELSASDESEPEEAPSSAAFDPELDDEDDDVEDLKTVESVATVTAPKTNPFSLKGGSTGFSSRSHSIFDCLDSMAKMTSSALGPDNVIDSVFARPAVPPSRKTSHPPSTGPTPAKKQRGVPDYLANPDRWTRYSLEDTAETSDQGNSRVAHQYLASLLQKKDEPVSRDSCNLHEKIIFSKPNRVAKEAPGNKTEKQGKETSTRLSHLNEDEDEDEGDKKDAQSKQKKDELDIKKKLMDVEKGDDEDATQEANAGFGAFKKTHHKMFRKSAEESSQNQA
ncbi:U5 small nuclear ribonucleoprotein TSSC4 [Eucyclogobius newberryi]|uniref:U5 small nuclear ribonucleoprotein TSSC4 n=1 Tax=Eucyclogobius newberryi TaxID=166745 RepID=UPI003B5B26E6